MAEEQRLRSRKLAIDDITGWPPPNLLDGLQVPERSRGNGTIALLPCLLRSTALNFVTNNEVSLRRIGQLCDKAFAV